MKKILVMACSVIILAAIAISGTIAYFTDSDAATNVFTVGNVVIKLNEEERGLDDKKNPVPDSTLKPFEQYKNLMPLVGSIDTVDENGLPKAKNFQDKIVTVSNTGKSDAYVRVYVGVPKELDEKGALHFVDGSSFTQNPDYKFPGINAATKIENQTVGTEKYNFYCFTLDKALPINTTTGAAIVGFYLDSKVDYDDGGENSENAAYYIGDKSVATNKLEFDLGSDDGVKIPVYVQAVQNAGFNDPATAFRTAFTQYPWGGSSSEIPAPGPKVDTSNLPTLKPSTNNENTYEISNAAELFAFAKMVNEDGNKFEGKTVKLMNDISLNNEQQWTPIGKSSSDGRGNISSTNHFKGKFDGNGKTIYHLKFYCHDSDWAPINYNDYYIHGLFGYCEGTIENLTLDHASITGVNWVGGIAGYLDGSGKIENCKVNNSEIKGFFNEMGQYSAIAGAIVGQANANASLTNCKTSSCNVYGTSSGEGESSEKRVGTIAGVAYEGKVTGCSATKCTAYYKNDTTDAIYDGIVGLLRSNPES